MRDAVLMLYVERLWTRADNHFRSGVNQTLASPHSGPATLERWDSVSAPVRVQYRLASGHFAR